MPSNLTANCYGLATGWHKSKMVGKYWCSCL